MSYQILPNFIFLAAVAGIILIILRHLQEAARLEGETAPEQGADKKLIDKGLPAEAFSRINSWLKLRTKKAWNFVLEAKDLKPAPIAGYKIRKLFGSRPPQQVHKLPLHQLQQPVVVREVKDEKYFLEQIKQQPKNLHSYYSLGKFYMENHNFSDAKDIFEYLVSHEPASSDYHGRLAYSLYKLAEYEKAAQHYQTSLALDSSQPNRYYNLGLCWEALNRQQDAIKTFEQAVSLEPNNSKYLISLSNSHSKSGNHAKAKQILKEAQKNRQPQEAAKVPVGSIHGQ